MILVGLSATPAGAQSPPCSPGTAPAVRFADLPPRLAFDEPHRFSLEYDDADWEVDGAIDVEIVSEARVLLARSVDDPSASLPLKLTRRHRSATVMATFEQVSATAGGGDEDFEARCVQSIFATVTGFAPPMRLTCNAWNEDGHVAYLTSRPRRCSIWREHWAHYESASFIKARWTSWGSSVARARATLTYNMGYRAAVRIKAYRPRLDCTGRFRVYTRVSIVGPDGRGTVRPDTCAHRP